MCERVKRDIKGPLPVRVRLGLGYGLGYQVFSPVFHFLTFCSLAFCPLAFHRDSIWFTPRKSAGNH